MFKPRTLSVLVKGAHFVSAREYVTMLYTGGNQSDRDEISNWFHKHFGVLPMPLGLIKTIVPTLSLLEAAILDPMRGFRVNLQAGLLRCQLTKFYFLDTFLTRSKDKAGRVRGMDELVRTMASMQYLQVVCMLCQIGEEETAKLVVRAHGRLDPKELERHAYKFFGRNRDKIMACADRNGITLTTAPQDTKLTSSLATDTLRVEANLHAPSKMKPRRLVKST
jgi:hypothetical protein